MRWALVCAFGCTGGGATTPKETGGYDSGASLTSAGLDSGSSTDSGTIASASGLWEGWCEPDLGGTNPKGLQWYFWLQLTEGGGAVTGGGEANETLDRWYPDTGVGYYSYYLVVALDADGTWDGQDLSVRLGADLGYGPYELGWLTGPVIGDAWAATLTLSYGGAYPYTCSLGRS